MVHWGLIVNIRRSVEYNTYFCGVSVLGEQLRGEVDSERIQDRKECGGAYRLNYFIINVLFDYFIVFNHQLSFMTERVFRVFNRIFDK